MNSDVHTAEDELLLESEIPLTDAEIEAALENEVKDILESNYRHKEQSLNLKREVEGNVERLSVSFRVPRDEDVYDYLTEEEKEQYYIEYQYLISCIAKSFHGSFLAVDLEDIEGYATIGFVKALNAYKLSYVVEFQTFASHCIKNELKRYLKIETKYNNNVVCSLDERVGDYIKEDGSEHMLLSDLLSDNHYNVEKIVEHNLHLEILNEILSELDLYFSDKDIFILKSFYELDGFTKRTQNELCMMFHCTQPAITARIKVICTELQMIFQNKEKNFYNSKK